ncbi:hypothetical protein NG798_26920 [Ancylothrix sp. C2]|uniref:hypothetical protein n=1 Tax=Ancylothrix sp. D3o TaxID=2953691 RepID=UPI0021BAE80E|nr:hypothetical protein [Ancylothrix sp. D3o]MCT7953437.1 hypothetical protein [Ancylothrix sp. D3o]
MGAGERENVHHRPPRHHACSPAPSTPRLLTGTIGLPTTTGTIGSTSANNTTLVHRPPHDHRPPWVPSEHRHHQRQQHHACSPTSTDFTGLPATTGTTGLLTTTGLSATTGPTNFTD